MRSTLLRTAFFVVVASLSSAAFGATYQLDPAHSFVVFRVGHMGISTVVGRFNEIAGTLTLDETSSAFQGASIDVKAASIDTGIARRDNHLRSTDFFDTAQFPLIQFRSSSVRSLDNDRYELAGDITLHGVTKPVTLEVGQVGAGLDAGGTARIGGTGTFTIKRSDFGMTGLLTTAGDNVTLTVDFEAAKR